MESFVLLPALGLGLLTAVTARRYGRDPILWGVAGALLFILAFPLLLWKGNASPGRRRLSAVLAEAESNPVARCLASGPATFDEVIVVTGLEEEVAAEQIDWLLDHDLIEPDGEKWRLTVRGELATS